MLESGEETYFGLTTGANKIKRVHPTQRNGMSRNPPGEQANENAIT